MKKRIIIGKTVYYLNRKDGNAKLTFELEEISVIGSSEMKELLNSNTAVFIIDTHLGMNWIEGIDKYDFWKNEVKSRIVEPEKYFDGFCIDDYPNNYCYVVRKCRNVRNNDDLNNYIILDMYH